MRRKSGEEFPWFCLKNFKAREGASSGKSVLWVSAQLCWVAWNWRSHTLCPSILVLSCERPDWRQTGGSQPLFFTTCRRECIDKEEADSRGGGFWSLVFFPSPPQQPWLRCQNAFAIQFKPQKGMQLILKTLESSFKRRDYYMTPPLALSVFILSSVFIEISVMGQLIWTSLLKVNDGDMCFARRLSVTIGLLRERWEMWLRHVQTMSL